MQTETCVYVVMLIKDQHVVFTRKKTGQTIIYIVTRLLMRLTLHWQKKFVLLFTLTSVVFSSCDVLQDVADIALSDTAQQTTPSLTEGEVASGLKEALTLGITNAVNTTSITDGFLNNVNIRLPFPEDAIKVREKAISWGMENKINQFEETLNHAAEEACKEALPIFKNAIVSMSIQVHLEF